MDLGSWTFKVTLLLSTFCLLASVDVGLAQGLDITVPSGSTLEVDAGGQIDMTCTNPNNVNVAWFKDNTRLNSDELHVVINDASSMSLLTVSDVTDADGGQYECGNADDATAAKDSVSVTVIAVSTEGPTVGATDRGDLAGQPNPETESEAEVMHGIKCYECTTVNNGDICDDPMDDEKLSQLTQKECNVTREQFSCYKLVTTHKQVGADDDDSTVLTTRMCASWDGDESSYSMDAGSGRWSTRSYCNSELCNKGHVTFTSAVTWLSGVLSICAALLMS